MKFKRILIKIMDKIMLDCRQATLLVSKKLDGKLKLTEKIRLKLHLMNCNFCYNFDIQSEKIDEIIKITPDDLYRKCRHKESFSSVKKKKIIDKLTENQQNND